MAYIKEGPFIDYSAPGVDAVLLNNIESALSAINFAMTNSAISSDGNGLLSVPALNVGSNPTILDGDVNLITINGATAGTITCFQPFVGPNFKIVIMSFNGYRNNGGGTQGVVIPKAFTQRAKYWCGDMPSAGVQFQKSGASAGIATMDWSVQPAGAAQTVFNSQIVQGPSFGEILGGWDTMTIPSGDTINISSVLLIIGW